MENTQTIESTVRNPSHSPVPASSTSASSVDSASTGQPQSEPAPMPTMTSKVEAEPIQASSAPPPSVSFPSLPFPGFRFLPSPSGVSPLAPSPTIMHQPMATQVPTPQQQATTAQNTVTPANTIIGTNQQLLDAGRQQMHLQSQMAMIQLQIQQQEQYQRQNQQLQMHIMQQQQYPPPFFPPPQRPPFVSSGVMTRHRPLPFPPAMPMPMPMPMSMPITMPVQANVFHPPPMPVQQRSQFMPGMVGMGGLPGSLPSVGGWPMPPPMTAPMSGSPMTLNMPTTQPPMPGAADLEYNKLLQKQVAEQEMKQPDVFPACDDKKALDEFTHERKVDVTNQVKQSIDVIASASDVSGSPPTAMTDDVGHSNLFLAPADRDMADDPQQLRQQIRHMQLINQQLHRQYDHIKHCCQELQSMVSADLNSADREPPQIIFNVQQLMEETLARDAQMQDIGVTADTDPGTTITPTPRATDFAIDPAKQLHSIQISAEDAARLAKMRGRQRGKPVPIRPLLGVHSKRKREASPVEAETLAGDTGAAAPFAMKAESSSTDEVHHGDLNQSSASGLYMDAIASLSALANRPSPVARARPSEPVDKKSVMHSTGRRRKDAVEHSYGTRESNRKVTFVFEASPRSSPSESDEDADLAAPVDTTSNAVSGGGGVDSDEYDDGDDDASDEDDVLNEVDDRDDEFVARKPRVRNRRARSTPTAVTSPASASKKRIALPGHHAMTSVSDRISRYPLTTIYMKIQQQWTVSKDDAKQMSREEQTRIVLVPVRFMVLKEEYRQERDQINEDEIFVIAKDICVLIHKRKGSVAKSIYNFEDSEKVRMHVCSRPREAGRSGEVFGGGRSVSGGGASTTGLSTQVLTVLSYRGVMRLMQHSRSTLASHVEKWAEQQWADIIANPAMLKEHKVRTTRMERFKNLPPAQQKQEEAKLLRIEEEEEMDVQEGFEEYASIDGEPNSDDDDESEVSARDDMALDGADLSGPSAAAGSATGIAPPTIPPSRPIRKKARGRAKVTARRKNRPAAAAGPTQPRAKRVKRENGPSETLTEANVPSGQPTEPAETTTTESPVSSDLPAASIVPPRPRSQSVDPTNPSMAVPPLVRMHRRTTEPDLRRLLAGAGVDLPIDPTVYQAQIVPDEEIAVPTISAHVHQAAAAAFAFPPPSPYISVPIPAQLSGVKSQVLAEHASMTVTTKPFTLGPAAAMAQTTQSAPLNMPAGAVPVTEPYSHSHPPHAPVPSSPIRQMDTFRSPIHVATDRDSKSTLILDDLDSHQQLTPSTQQSSTHTSPLFTATTHPTPEEEHGIKTQLSV